MNKEKKNNKNGKIWQRSLIIAAGSFVFTLLLYFLGSFTFFENKTYDQRMKLAANYKQPCDQIIFIGVDQKSIDWAKEEYGWGWPWPREAYARVVEFISAGNPNSIAFDILYTEPSVYGENDDETFAAAEKDSGKVIQTLYIYGEGDNTKVLPPVDSIKDNAAMLGNITSLMDKDDIIRRGRLFYELNGEKIPTLGTAPLYLTNQKNDFDFSEVPTLKDGSVLLRYQRNLDDYIPYWINDILSSYDIWKSGDTTQEPAYVPEDFADTYVYVAYYAPGLFDICSSPVSQVFPGVGVHITTLDNFLTKSFIHKMPEVLTCLWILFVSVLCAVFITLASTRQHQATTVIYMILGLLVGAVLCIGLPILLFIYGYWMQLIAPSAAFLLTFLVGLGLSLTIEGKQKRFIKSAFSQCLSKDVVNQIMNDPSSFTLGGKNFQMTAIFTDIRKFSSFSELLTASQLGQLLNYYLTKMSDVIIDEYGTVDKYEGDAIVALVGAPVEMSDHAERACAAAVKMKKTEVLMNTEIIRIAAEEKPADMDEDLYNAFKIMVENNKTIFTRIGINSGEMIAGYFGSENKKNYTMMGNNVNLASRLEGVNKQYSTNGIMCSQATRELLGDRFVVRSLDRVRVVNVNTPIRLFEVLEEKSEASETLLKYVEKWETAMTAFESKAYDDALQQMKDLSAEKPEDNVAKYYISLLENFFTKGTYPKEADAVGVEYNPDDGVFKLLQK
ncbi:MAG: adenylate/guanylate cyclase domain-containing protein [Treponema sp.]|nr:adenylate/guanylate cyclase domain-containing protein [Treponema sp.]